MAALKLIEEARSAGLKLRAEGDRLVIRGPSLLNLSQKRCWIGKRKFSRSCGSNLRLGSAPIVDARPQSKTCFLLWMENGR